MAYGAILGKSTTTWTNDQILSSDTASLFGLSSSAIPDEVFTTARSLITTVQNTVAGKANIVIGSYVGTGTYGSENPNMLELPFVPVFLVIDRPQYKKNPQAFSNIEYPFYGRFYPYLYDEVYRDKAYSYQTSNAIDGGFAKMEGTTLYWYGPNAQNQFNSNGSYYQYWAIG